MVSQLDSHHRYINNQWICKECKAWFWLLKNGHIWLGTSPVVLKFILLFFHFVVCNCLFAKNIHSHSAIGENDRTISTTCVFKNFLFSSGNLCRLTCDLGSLSLLSNRADSLVTSVFREVRNCAGPPDRLRSEISFLRTCKLQHSTFDIVYTSHSPVETFHWLCVYMVVKLHAHWSKHLLNVKFLTGTLASLVTDFANLCRHIDKWNKR